MTLKVGSLTADRADGLRRIRDRGPQAWHEGLGRTGNARKMFRAMAADGLCSEEPFQITDAGRRALEAYDAEATARRRRHEPLRMLGVARYG